MRRARRHSDQGLHRRPRRRVLQRSAGLLPLDQLRAAVLQRAAHAPYDDCASCRSRRRCSSSRATRSSTTTRRTRNWGHPAAEARPARPARYTWKGNAFSKDANGNYRFVYSGKDAQAGRNINAVILEMPLDYVTDNPKRDRIVNSWGESWVLKAVEQDRDDPRRPAALAHRHRGRLVRDLFTPRGRRRRRAGASTSSSTPTACRSPTPR